MLDSLDSEVLQLPLDFFELGTLLLKLLPLLSDAGVLGQQLLKALGRVCAAYLQLLQQVSLETVGQSFDEIPLDCVRHNVYDALQR